MSSLDAFYEGGPKSFAEAFPPICVTSHWDPTVMSAHIMPAARPVHLALDPRPASLICTSYYDTSAGDAPLPTSSSSPSFSPAAVAGSVPFPPGGAARFGFPNAEYQGAIDRESDLFRMQEQLTKCAERRYLGRPGTGHQTNIVPGISGATAESLSPYATVVAESTGCRSEDDAAAWARSARLFFNPTRYDRTTAVPATLHKAEGRYACAQ